MWFIAICIFILGVIAWFIVSLVMFLKTPKDLIGKRDLWKTFLIVSSCVLAITIVFIAAFIILLMIAIAHM